MSFICCIVEKCSAFNVTRATVSTQNVYPGAKVTITCDLNLYADGTAEHVLNVTCGTGGVWQPAVPTTCNGKH